MRTFEKNTEDRKVLKKRVEELTGLTASYTGLPRCAFEIGAFSVEKDGSLHAADDADEAIISTLIEERLIRPEGVAEDDEAWVAGSYTVGDTAEDSAEDENTILKPEISFPLENHTGVSLRNLMNILYSRGSLISKATGGDFGVDDGFVEGLSEDLRELTAVQVLEKVKAYEEEHGPVFRGVKIADGKLAFTGFPEQGDPVKIRAYMDLAAAINETALTSKRINAKKGNESNEKYYFRIFLVRCGLDGKEYAESRKSLLENLTGHTAFRTSVEEERWKARQAQRRAERKAQKEAEEREAEASENTAEEG